MLALASEQGLPCEEGESTGREKLRMRRPSQKSAPAGRSLLLCGVLASAA